MQFVKESIFVSSIRSFFNAFLAMIGILVGFSILIGIGASLSSSTFAGAQSDHITMEVLPDADGKVPLFSDSAPIILQVDLKGIIGLEENVGEVFEDILRKAQNTPFIKTENIKGVLLEIVSPGGVASESEEIYKALVSFKEKHKIPLYSYSSSVCASGGYMIACASDKIFSSPSCVVGSVGVKTGPFFNYYGLMEKHGVKAVELTAGKNKIAFPKFTPVQEGTKNGGAKSYQDIIDITEDLYGQFTSLVANSRGKHGLTQEDLTEKYGASVYLAPRAQELGYVDDASSTRSSTLLELIEMAGIEKGTEYQVIRFKQKRFPFQSFINSCMNMWTMKASEWLTGIKHQGALDGKILYHFDLTD